ncbi:MAG: 30S ribosomal protein S9, partial [Brevinematales bacterium]
MAQKKIYATGRRKTSVARVFLIPGGKGKFTVNNKDVESYFPSYYHETVYHALNLTEIKDKVDIYATVKGGGLTGQAEALRHGIARALDAYDKEKFHKLLKEHGLLTRDARMVE